MNGFFLLFFVTFVFTLVVQVRVSSTFSKYSGVRAGMGQTGAAVARRILDAHGLYDVRIERVHGSLTDHYDPRTKVLRLSDSVFASPSASAVGVAAHEVGHAIQHAENYAPIVLRGKLVPVVNVASRFSWIAIMLGLFIGYSSQIIGEYMIAVGIILFAGGFFFAWKIGAFDFEAFFGVDTEKLTLSKRRQLRDIAWIFHAPWLAGKWMIWRSATFLLRHRR